MHMPMPMCTSWLASEKSMTTARRFCAASTACCDGPRIRTYVGSRSSSHSGPKSSMRFDESLPRTEMWQPVSSSSSFCVRPRGPMSVPMSPLAPLGVWSDGSTNLRPTCAARAEGADGGRAGAATRVESARRKGGL